MGEVKIPEGYERCEWVEAEAIVGWKFYSPVEFRFLDGSGKQYIQLSNNSVSPFDVNTLEFFGVIPVRKATPKPVVIKVESFFDAGHTYHSFDAKAGDFQAGTQFIQVTPEVRAALAKDGIEVGS